MELIAILVIGVISGLLASILYGGYSLGALGNGIAGVTGALFLGKYLAIMFGVSTYAGMLIGGTAGAFIILVVFSAGESLARKKKRLF